MGELGGDFWAIVEVYIAFASLVECANGAVGGHVRRNGRRKVTLVASMSSSCLIKGDAMTTTLTSGV